MTDPKTLRARVQSQQVLPAWEIPNHGFGVAERTRRMADGTVVTEEVQRVYRLACGSIIQSAEEIGGVCWGCRLEIEARRGTDPVIAALLPEQLDYAALVHRDRYHLCSVAFCNRWGCPRHVDREGEGPYFCTEHFPSGANDPPAIQAIEFIRRVCFFGKGPTS